MSQPKADPPLPRPHPLLCLALPNALELISSKRWSSLGRCGSCQLSEVPNHEGSALKIK